MHFQCPFAGLDIGRESFFRTSLIACPLVLDTADLATRVRRCLTVAGPAAGIFFAICFPVLRQIKTSQLYVGEPTIAAALYNLVFLNIRAIPGHPGLFATGVGTHGIEYFFLPAVLLFVIAVSAHAYRGGHYPARTLLPVLTLLLALVAIVGAHFLAGLNYPVDRLGLPLFVVFGLAWAIAASQAPKPRMRALNALLAMLLIAQFLTQFHTRYFALWQFDMPMKQVARLIEENVRGAPAGSVTVSATWFHVPALEYYRRADRIAALQPIERREHTQLDGFDYYVLNVKDDDDLKSAPIPALVPLFRDDFSGVLLARKP